MPKSSPALGDQIMLPHGGSLVERNQFLRVCIEYIIALVVDSFVFLCILINYKQKKTCL